MSINFPPKTASAASYRFWYVVFPFSFVSRYFKISLDFLVDPLVVQ